MAGKYFLHPAGTSQFHWALRAGNGETILSSQLYGSLESAEAAVQSCRTHSANDARFSRLSTLDQKAYFVLTDADGGKIGTSEMYPSESKRDKGIATCKADAATAVMKFD
jgi:uncharacterized protein YegP (UPF0339 family)